QSSHECEPAEETAKVIHLEPLSMVLTQHCLTKGFIPPCESTFPYDYQSLRHCVSRKGILIVTERERERERETMFNADECEVRLQSSLSFLRWKHSRASHGAYRGPTGRL